MKPLALQKIGLYLHGFASTTTLLRPMLVQLPAQLGW